MDSGVLSGWPLASYQLPLGGAHNLRPAVERSCFAAAGDGPGAEMQRQETGAASVSSLLSAPGPFASKSSAAFTAVGRGATWSTAGLSHLYRAVAWWFLSEFFTL